MDQLDVIKEAIKLSIEAKAMATALVKTLNNEQLEVFNKYYKDCLTSETLVSAKELGLSASLKDLLDKQ